ncbi:MAG: hypothetical protein HYU31_07420 [Deltaproteobacteria bacterium]|nr:hypothetical protein [Deltaproteobacteria bacterium]
MRTLLTMGSPRSVATGTFSASQSFTGSRSPCQPHQTMVYPWRMRKPLPASSTVLGSLLWGASLRKATIRLPPRLGASKNILPLLRAMSSGFKIQKSLEYSARPRRLRGALPRLTMILLSRFFGSTSP